MVENLQGIEKIVKKFNPAYPFTYNFVDQQYAAKFRDQEQTAMLALVFSLLAICISCLGLFGLASYIAETRIKEIGIRKVLGATCCFFHDHVQDRYSQNTKLIKFTTLYNGSSSKRLW